MTKEGYKKHEKLIKAWLDGKPIQILCENGSWTDVLADVKWKEHKEYRIKPPKTEFEDCVFYETEYIVASDGKVKILDVSSMCYSDVSKIRHKLFRNKEMAEAYAILPKLIRLMDEYNEGWTPDWEDRDTKYYIGICDNKWTIGLTGSAHYPLVFKTDEARNRFFNDHKDLLEIAKPLL